LARSKLWDFLKKWRLSLPKTAAFFISKRN
jgi:hypothetical protein